MRNRFPGTCYRCGERVEPNEGHFERVGNRQLDKLGESIRGKKWLLQHANCAIVFRGTTQIAGGKKTLTDDFRDVS
jgi:hypothetical protein